jgi:hypothetical protein
VNLSPSSTSNSELRAETHERGPVTGAKAARRWRKVLLATIAVVAAAEGMARLVSPQLEPVNDWPRSDYVQHEQGLAARADQLQLLILGSSVAGRAPSPDDILDAGGPGPGYNYWLAGPSMRSISLLATDVLLERASPSVVIIGLTMREFNNGPSQQNHFDALRQSYGLQTASGRRTAIDTMDHTLQSVSALARHRLAFQDPARLVRELRAPALIPEHIAPDGHLSDRGDNQLADEPPSHLAQERFAMANYDVSQEDLDALARLLDRLHARGITTLVVNLPVTEHFIDMADDAAPITRPI